MGELLVRLWAHIAPQYRRQFWAVLALMVLSSVLEVVSIGAVLPFLGVLTAADQIFAHPWAQTVNPLLGIQAPEQMLLPFTGLFALMAVLAGVVRLLVLRVSMRLTFGVGAALSTTLFRHTLQQPYEIHIARNSSEVISAISGKVAEVIFYVIMQLLTLLSGFFLILIVGAALLVVMPIVSVLILLGFSSIYGLIVLLSRRRLLNHGMLIARQSTEVVKILQEGLGGIRDVLINNSQDAFCKSFQSAEESLRSAQAASQIISQGPRHAIESIALLMIAALAFFFSRQPAGMTAAIPLLAAIALSLQRILPALHQMYGAWSLMYRSQASLRDAMELMDQPAPETQGHNHVKSLQFQRDIVLRDIAFRYTPTSPWVISNFNLTITKGSRIGFVGTTGSGKSTLLDLVMGLLQPSAGTLEVDGQIITSSNLRAWQANVAHVPQTIFLADCSIAENIAFGIAAESIDHVRVRQAAEQAQIAEVVAQLPQGYQTLVGERGVQLSGGQRQRIGIARALYKRAEVIIFDESTSALDKVTENSVMQAINGLDRNITMLMIAHNVSTLSGCSQVIEIRDDGTQKVVGDV